MMSLIKEADDAILQHSYEELQENDSGESPKPRRSFLIKLKDFVLKYFLPISLIFAVVFGTLVPAPGVFLNHKATVYVCVSIMFLYSGLYLKTSAIKDALKAYKAYIWGFVSILGVTCIVGGQLTKLLDFDEQPNIFNPPDSNKTKVEGNSLGPFEFKIGLILYTSMPCTIASGVIMVSQLNGHFALAIMLTVVSNVVGIFTVPLYVSWFVTSDINIQFDIGAIVLKLFLTLFIPILVGKTLRINRKLRTFITVPKRKLVLKTVSLCCLALILLVKTSVSSENGGMKKLTAIAALVIVFWTLTLHILFLLINTLAVFILMLPTDMKKCIVILASQKTLAQAVAVSVFLPPSLGDQGLIAVAMVFCHITVIVFDSVFIAIWLYIEKVRSKKEKQKSLELPLQKFYGSSIDDWLIKGTKIEIPKNK